jgi:hypothetical protein
VICINEPPPLLFIGQGHPISSGLRVLQMRELHLGTNVQAEHGTPGSTDPRLVWSILGSANPGGHMSCYAFSQWLVGGPQGQFLVHGEFGVALGP